jgi:hypothetical protein
MARGNRKASLATRIAEMVANLPTGPRPPEKIVGSAEWRNIKNIQNPNSYNRKKAQESFFSTYSLEERKEYAKIIPSRPTSSKRQNEVLIDTIHTWIDDNEWQYINGGEHHGSWVNPGYPNRLFSESSTTLLCSGNVSETAAFPVCAMEDDHLGLACHITCAMQGTKSTVKPNKWTSHDSTRTGRKQVRINSSLTRRTDRWQAFQEAEKIKDPVKRADAILDLKASFLSDNISREYQKIREEDQE